MNRILNLLIAIDQLMYVLLTLGAGHPDETLSAAAYRTEKQGKFFGRLFRPVIDFLFYFAERKHCENAFKAELNRSQLPKDYKKV